jgi:hypothetical protein
MVYDGHMAADKFTVRRAPSAGPSSAFGRFAWLIVRPDGSVYGSANSKIGAQHEADRINAARENR